MTFSLAADPSTTISTLCILPAYPTSPTTWGFSACFRRACLDPIIQSTTDQVVIRSTTTTTQAHALPSGGSTITFIVLEPLGVDVSASATTMDGSQIAFSSTQSVTVVPPTGIQSLTVTATVNPAIDDVGYAFVMAVTYAPLPTPAEPTHSCPCWTTPQGGVCPGIQLPITLVGLRL